MVKHYTRSCLWRFNKEQNMLLSVLLIANVINISRRAKLARTTFLFYFLLLQDVPSLVCFPSSSLCVAIPGSSSQLLEWVCPCGICETDCGSWKTTPLERTVTSWEWLVAIVSFVRSCHVLQYVFQRTVINFDRESEVLPKNSVYSYALLMPHSDLLFGHQ